MKKIYFIHPIFWIFCFSLFTFGVRAEEDFQQILKKDHQNVNELIRKALAGGLDKTQLSDLDKNLRKSLKGHMEAEEKYLYPELEKNPSTRNLAIEAEAEHQAAKSVLKKIDLKKETPDDLTRLETLQTLLKQHMTMEEGLLFSAVKSKLGEAKEAEISKNISEYHSKKM